MVAGGHAWLQGACVVMGGMCSCWGVCVVAGGVWLGGHAWLLGGMHGCGGWGHVCLRGGACVGYDEILAVRILLECILVDFVTIHCIQ